MRYVAIAGLLGVWLATPAQAQTMPPPFENLSLIVCADRPAAAGLLAVYENDPTIGDQLLGDLAKRGVCERTNFSGKPVVDVYKIHPADSPWEGHVFEVDVTGGEVLKGRAHAYMLLYIAHDNEA